MSPSSISPESQKQPDTHVLQAGPSAKHPAGHTGSPLHTGAQFVLHVLSFFPNGQTRSSVICVHENEHVHKKKTVIVGPDKPAIPVQWLF